VTHNSDWRAVSAMGRSSAHGVTGHSYKSSSLASPPLPLQQAQRGTSAARSNAIYIAVATALSKAD
jgi:hypothetical protein